MNNVCKTKLMKHAKKANINDGKYIKKLFNYKNKKIENIYDVSNILNTTRSSTSRFIQRIGYDYFKNFKNDFNQESNAKKITISDIKNGIAVLCSKRSNDLTLILEERLKEKYPVNVFNDLTKNIGNWIKENQESVFILFSITGDSHRFNIAITELAKLKIYPKIIIITFSRFLSIFNKYNSIEVLFCDKNNFSPKTWQDCNIAISKMILKTFEYLNK